MIEKLKMFNIKEMIFEFKWIYGYGEKHIRILIIYTCIGFAGTILAMSNSVISKEMIDGVLNYDSSKLAVLIVCFFLTQFLGLFLSSAKNRIASVVDVKIEKRIRSDVYDNVLKTNWESISDYHSGDLLSRLSGDISNVSGSVIRLIPDFLVQVMHALGTLFLILYYEPSLALIALTTAPVSLLMSLVVTKKMRTLNKGVREANSLLISFIEESLINLQLIKSFDLYGYYNNKFEAESSKYVESKLNHNRFSVMSTLAVSTAGILVSALSFLWCLYKLWTGNITYGTMLMFLQLSSSLTGTLASIVYMLPTAVSSLTSANRLIEICDLEKENIKPDVIKMIDEAIREKEKIMVSVDNIGFSYSKGGSVLEKMSFAVNAGETVAIVGPSGQGKTTIIKMLLGLVSPQLGNLAVKISDEVFDVDCNTRGLFSYVPQENILFTGTILENLKMANPDATEDEIEKALKVSCSYDFVDSLPEKLNTMVSEKGSNFSVGQIQRLSIARALLSKSPILLLDEATSALDQETEKTLLKNIKKEIENKICILTTHRMSVLSISDRTFEIKDKKLMEKW